ncbi:MAG: hypothetical protein J7K22_01860 [Nanoarchaeota archaeon]|nr:hypothetical protein [Nanoarchaeota archaeon]
MKLKMLFLFFILFASFSFSYAELEKISVKEWAKIGDVVKVTAVFKNEDVDSVAQFKCEIIYNGEIIKVLESDKVLVKNGEEANLSVYFEPKLIGKYYVNGYVVYGNKISETKEASFTVLETNTTIPMSTTDLILVLGGLCIFAVVLQVVFNRKR